MRNVYHFPNGVIISIDYGFSCVRVGELRDVRYTRVCYWLPADTTDAAATSILTAIEAATIAEQALPSADPARALARFVELYGLTIGSAPSAAVTDVEEALMRR